MAQQQDRPLSVQERRGIYQQLEKSTSPSTPKKGEKGKQQQQQQQGENADLSGFVTNLKQLINEEKTKTSSLQQEVAKLKSENESLKGNNKAATPQAKPAPAPAPTPAPSTKEEAFVPTSGDVSTLKQNKYLARVSCPNHPFRLAYFISKSGKAGCFTCAQNDQGISPNEVSQVEKAMKEEEASKHHQVIAAAVREAEKNAPPPAAKPVVHKPVEVVSKETAKPAQAVQQPSKAESVDLSKEIAKIDEQLKNVDQKKDLFSYNILLNKKTELLNRQRGFASVEESTGPKEYPHTKLGASEAQQKSAQVQQNLNQVNKDLSAVDLTKPVDLFQYNVKLNQKINLESELKQLGSPSSASAPAPARSSGKQAPVAAAPAKKDGQVPSGFVPLEVSTVVGKQVFYVKPDGDSMKNLKAGGRLKLTVDSHNLPLAAAVIIVMAGATNQFTVEKSNQTKLLSETSSLSGFTAIARYVARRYDNLKLYDESVEIDAFFNLAIDLKKKKQFDVLPKVENHLKNKKKFLVGDRLSLADLIVWDAIRSLELAGSPAQLSGEVASWYKSLNEKPEVNNALKFLSGQSSQQKGSSSGGVSSAEKEEYIKRVMADFSISRAEASQLWDKFMGPLGLQGGSDEVSSTGDLALRQQTILRGISGLENRVFELLKKIPANQLPEKDRVALLQISNLEKLHALTARMDKLQGISTESRVEKMQLEVLEKLRALEVRTRWIENLMPSGGSNDVGSLLDKNLQNLQQLAARINALEGGKNTNCLFCGQTIEQKEFELFSPHSTPVCTKCYLSGRYITASNAMVQVETQVTKTKEKRKTKVAVVTEKDDSLVHYYVALSGIAESTETEEEVVVDKITKVKETIISPGHATPKLPFGTISSSQQGGNEQPKPVDHTKAWEAMDSNTLYYLAINGLLNEAVGGSSAPAVHSQKPAQQGKQEASSVNLDQLDSNTLYYLVLTGGVGDSGSSSSSAPSSPLEHLRSILTSELAKYKETTVSAAQLNPSTPEQEKLVAEWVRLYKDGSKDEVDSFIASQNQVFTSFGSIAFLLKNVLFQSKLPPKTQQ